MTPAPTCTPLGSPSAASAAAAHLHRMADGLDAAGRIGGPAPTDWSGAAVHAFVAALAVQPREFAAAADACREVAAALARHGVALVDAHALQQRAAVTADQAAQTVLAEEAARSARESAGRAADRVQAAADRAPRRPPLLSRAWRTAVEWRTETRLGGVEAAQGLLSTAIRFNPNRWITRPTEAAADAGAMGDAVLDVVRHPTRTAGLLLDQDTWRDNPARAIGHLIPDLVAAVATGGAAATTRAATIAARTRAAIARAAAADASRRAAADAAHQVARRGLLDSALSRAAGRTAPGGDWHGPGGTTLAGRHAAAADEFWKLSVSTEKASTRAVREAAAAGDGRLEGLDHRLKQPDSFLRKVATALNSPADLHGVLIGADDTVRYAIVIDAADHVERVRHVAAALEGLGLHQVAAKNHWLGPRYRGINSVWADPTSGSVFEVQFHTPLSYRITKETHPMYEEMRLDATPPQRRRALEALIAAEYRRVPLPTRIEELTQESILPVGRPDPIQPPPDLRAAAALAGAAGAATVGGSDAAQPVPPSDQETVPVPGHQPDAVGSTPRPPRSGHGAPLLPAGM